MRELYLEEADLTFMDTSAEDAAIFEKNHALAVAKSERVARFNTANPGWHWEKVLEKFGLYMQIGKIMENGLAEFHFMTGWSDYDVSCFTLYFPVKKQCPELPWGVKGYDWNWERIA